MSSVGMREWLVCRANTRLNSLSSLACSHQGERRRHSPDPCYPNGSAGLAAYLFSVVVECSLRFGFSGTVLKGLFFNGCHERLSLAFFVRLSMFRFIFHCR